MVSVSHISKSYGPLQVLRDLSFTVSKGEMVAVTGPSGSGKTTLLQILGTLDRPDSGQVVINGVSTDTLEGDQLARFRNQHIGFIFQDSRLLPEFTAWENILLPACIAYGVSPSGHTSATPTDTIATEQEISTLEQVPGTFEQTVQWCRQLVELCNIHDCVMRQPRQLSGGQQQRVAFARALSLRPSLVLADEPTGNLDPENAENVMTLLNKLRTICRCTVILSTHNLELTRFTDSHIRLAS